MNLNIYFSITWILIKNLFTMVLDATISYCVPIIALSMLLCFPRNFPIFLTKSSHFSSLSLCFSLLLKSYTYKLHYTNRCALTSSGDNFIFGSYIPTLTAAGNALPGCSSLQIPVIVFFFWMVLVLRIRLRSDFEDSEVVKIRVLKSPWLQEGVNVERKDRRRRRRVSWVWVISSSLRSRASLPGLLRFCFSLLPHSHQSM